MKIVFRVDASTRIGGGHLMRCISLAETLNEKGAKIRFICREYEGNLISYLRSKSFQVTALPHTTSSYKQLDDRTQWMSLTQAHDAYETIAALNSEKPDYLIVDHYGLDAIWEELLRPHSLKIMVIDDVANRRHNCDILLDQNYSISGASRYHGLVPDSCEMLLGPSFTLLRYEFLYLRKKIINNKNLLNRILVFFTLGDDHGETLKAMQGIGIFNKALHVDVVVGIGNPKKSSIEEMCAALGWGYHCQIDYMPMLIANASFAIGSGGSSSWERCSLGLPALITILADNQVDIANALDQAGININLGWYTKLVPEDYSNALRALNTCLISSMSERASKLVDGMGTQRVASILTAKQALNLN